MAGSPDADSISIVTCETELHGTVVFTTFSQPLTSPIVSDAPRISVVVPAFNNGAYIAETLRTILVQTLQPTEIIVVDDGSTDGTEAVVRSIGDPRIQYHWQENSGVSVARNRGLDVATGEFVSFLDADDRWRPNALSVQYGLLSSDSRFVCCFANFVRFLDGSDDFLPDQFQFYPELRRVRTAPIASGKGFVIEGNAFEQIISFGDFPAFTQTMMFRRAQIQSVRFDPRLIRCQDADFVLRVFLRGQVAFSSEIVAEVRRHPRNATRDVDMMPVDKLRALECVSSDSLTIPFAALMSQRLMRARFDAASALVARGRYRDSIALWSRALRSSGSLLRKLSGSARFLLALMR